MVSVAIVSFIIILWQLQCNALKTMFCVLSHVVVIIRPILTDEQTIAQKDLITQ